MPPKRPKIEKIDSAQKNRGKTDDRVTDRGDKDRQDRRRSDR